ncbi:ABC-type multidrug transport system fused ATPase/permease subunit [Pedobacter cryoconitis]|uniref:ABC-type multidrug transport system fused ATPase/permease subunit n=1 Tax=Pedobacter cryoconitis TaxID=188932 RepID=A0A7W8ZIC7_9SPHI|nr:ABC transporter ATP-binding protein [Pedobacter cryoconitis]MBB5634473.1 ABC-type multidrug transport system fused ATPase/permease subunit [Pedobacter cryoconitis]
MKTDFIKNKVKALFIDEIYAYFLPYRKYFVYGMLFLVLSGSLQLSLPLLLGKSVNLSFNPGTFTDTNTLMKHLGILIGMLILQFSFTFVRNYYFLLFSEKSVGTLKKDLFHKYLSYPLPFHNKNKVGDMLSVITNDVMVVRELYSSQFSDLLYSTFILIFCTGILISINLKLSLILLIVFPAIIYLASFFGKKIRKTSKETQSLYAGSNSVIEEDLHQIRSIKIFGKERKEVSLFARLTEDIIQKTIHNSLFRSFFSLSSSFIIIAALIVILWYACIMVVKNEIVIADLVTFIVNMIFIINSFSTITQFFGNLERSRGATVRLVELLNEKVETEDFVNSSPMDFQHTIEFKNISLSYGEADVKVLDGLNLEIKKGEKVAIVGPNGSGKSSLLNLLLRLYTPTGGTVEIDGVNINQIGLANYRSKFGVVSQDLELFNRSVIDNIRYGTETIDDSRLESVLAHSNVIDFINDLPEKEHTKVGKNGSCLSGGQKQRVSLARALYKNADIMILDEATSALDSSLEESIKANLDSALSDKTLIFVTHKFSLIENFDKIIVLDSGKISAIGTHQQLLQLNKTYATLYHLQNRPVTIKKVA